MRLFHRARWWDSLPNCIHLLTHLFSQSHFLLTADWLRNRFELYSDEVYRSVGLPNDNDKVNKVKRLFLDESLAEVKANLQDMLGKLLANEWTRFHADNPAANQALKAKIEENKTAIMLSLTYLNRYYDLKFGDYNLKELVLFKPDFYGEKVPLLDRLIKIGRSTENQLKGADNVNMFARQLKAESKASDLVAYLDYNRRLLTDFEDMDSWFKDATRGFMRCLKEKILYC